MDSGNSGSLQSSSGAEEECDSRAAVHHSSFIPNQQQPHPTPPPFNHHLINQINPFFFTPSPQHQLLNLPSFSDHHFLPSSSQPAVAPTSAKPTDQPTPPPPRNPKKRSRASRRAPTTVLTTDTTNFRAMVQEFTGIPAPPFASSSPPASFDLFGRTSAMNRSNSNNFDQLSPYLLRPFPHKLQSSTMQNTIAFPSNPLINQYFLNPKTTQNAVVSSNGFGVIGQSHELHTTLPDLVSTAPTTVRNDDHMTSGNWNSGGSVNYTNGKESSHGTADLHVTGMKGDQGFIEPWITSD